MVRALFDQEKAIRDQCGSWQSCIENRQLPDNGLVEKAAISLSGWIQCAYAKDPKAYFLTVAIGSQTTQRTSRRWYSPLTTNDQTTPGTRSWKPSEIRKCSQEDLTDILVENRRIIYGVSAEVFVVLLILGSWDIIFADKNVKSSISHLGKMWIRKSSASDQITCFEDHGSAVNREYSIPVRTAIDLAIGIFRVHDNINDIDKVDLVILPDRRSLNSRNKTGPMSYWKSNPIPAQLEEIRYSLEKLVKTPSERIDLYSSNKYSADNMEIFTFMRGLRSANSRRRIQTAAARVALVISNLEPWAVLPATQKHITEALCDVLKRQTGDGQEHLKERLKKQNYTTSGWTPKELQLALDKIPRIVDSYFSKSSEKCSVYHTAMKAVFSTANLSKGNKSKTVDNEKLIRLTLAAKVSSEILSKNNATKKNLFSEIFTFLCRTYELKGTSSLADDTFVQIYATYLYGWFGDATEAATGWRDAYQRTVFIE
ncbi:hypothetical protein DPV78_009208 [Talaromyces pinophilus]|nr:hypothetical protein DPV78_009208 [Talaromyces pinophilus]